MSCLEGRYPGQGVLLRGMRSPSAAACNTISLSRTIGVRRSGGVAARALFLRILCILCVIGAFHGIADPAKDDDCG